MKSNHKKNYKCKLSGRIFVLCFAMICMSACGGKSQEDDWETGRQDMVEDDTIVGDIWGMPESSEPTNTPNPTDIPEPIATLEPTATPVSTNTPEPINTPVPTDIPKEDTGFVSEELIREAEIKQAEIREDVGALFKAVLDCAVEDVQDGAAARVSRAITNVTNINIVSVSEDVCNITVFYPDIVVALREADAQLPADATQEQIEDMLIALAKSIEKREIELTEKHFEVEVVEVDDFYTIRWTDELYDAVTGGLYSIEWK